MRSSPQKLLAVPAALLVALLCCEPAAGAPGTGLGSIRQETESLLKPGAVGEELGWYNVLDNALGVAKEEYRPVVVFFYSPTDGWSGRMRAQVLNDEAVKVQLEHFVRVEVVAEDHPNTAANYLVRRVPAIRILSAEGRVLHGRDGFVGAPEMVRMLRGAVNAEYLKKSDEGFQKLIGELEANAVKPGEWAAVMLGLGEPQKRETLRQLILKLNPFPRKEFVALLSDARLSVRLGALETLEEIAGGSFGFNPWIGSKDSPENRVALEQWSDWIEKSGEEAVTSVYSVLSEEQIAGYIRDVIGEDRERAIRARTMLRNGGDNAAESLQSFLAHSPDIPQAAKNRVRELFYALMMPISGGHDPDTLAHRLIFGNLDSKLETITTLKETGRAAMPILGDFLEDPDPLVRETAADAYLSAGRAMAIPVIEKHLQKETDNDVAMAVLRSIAVNEIKKGAPLVTAFADHEEEDLAIMALESLGALRAREQAKIILDQLSDERWRVRVAALEAIGKINDGSHAKKVRALLKDDDEFVRVAAVQTVAALDDSGAVGGLLDLYRKHEETRGPVVSALLSMKKPLPKSLKEDLAKSSPDAILSVIDAVGQTGTTQLGVIEEFVQHRDLDVACAAVRLMAEHGMARSDYQRTIGAVLREGPSEKAFSALDSMELEEPQFRYYRSRLATPDQAVPGTPPQIREIYDVFLERKKPAASREGEGSGDPVMDLFSAMRPYFESDENESARHSAALLLARAGDPVAIDFLIEDTANRSVTQRKKVAESLEDASADALPVLVDLMRDRSPDVRATAALAVLEHEGQKKFLETFFEELNRPGTRLMPWEVDIDYYSDAIEEGVGKELSNHTARSILKKSLDPALLSFAALTLRYASKFGDAEFLLPLTESEDPFLRRAAWFTIGRTDQKLLKEHLDTLASDPSEKVRAVLPFVLGEEGEYFVHYFDEQNSQRFYDYSSGSYTGRTRRLDDEMKAALVKMSDDPAPAVRIDSAFLLMVSGVRQDPAKLESTLSAFPDRDSVQRRVSDYLEEKYQTLDQSYRFLTNYIDPSRVNEETLERIYSHFKINPAGDGDPGYQFVDRAPDPAEKTSSPPEVADPDTMAEGNAVEVIFFHNPGCKECDRVESYLEEMKASFTRLQVAHHNIRESESARLNEALSERFGVPQKIRMVAPSVFTGDGYLIKDDILPVELGDLIVRSSSTNNSGVGWSALQSDEISAAGSAIKQRYSSVGLAVIFSAGILDGINPCAFATIILFLSYLQIARHSPRQILMVGLAFIVAVFLTYFALGLGLVELVTRLQFLEGAGLVLNGLLAVFVFVIMALSFRDGILCLQGRLADTTLQLPVFLKDRIRRVARTGARHHRFVIAAFLSGVVISVLELACTGQVYLPTINYMVQEGVGSAYFFLILYNLAFVLPLVVIFILAFYGLRSDALIEFQRKHSAVIKFATAGLFLALFVLLVTQMR